MRPVRRLSRRLSIVNRVVRHRRLLMALLAIGILTMAAGSMRVVQFIVWYTTRNRKQQGLRVLQNAEPKRRGTGW